MVVKVDTELRQSLMYIYLGIVSVVGHGMSECAGNYTGGERRNV